MVEWFDLLPKRNKNMSDEDIKKDSKKTKGLFARARSLSQLKGKKEKGKEASEETSPRRRSIEEDEKRSVSPDGERSQEGTPPLENKREKGKGKEKKGALTKSTSNEDLKGSGDEGPPTPKKSSSTDSIVKPTNGEPEKIMKRSKKRVSSKDGEAVGKRSPSGKKRDKSSKGERKSKGKGKEKERKEKEPKEKSPSSSSSRDPSKPKEKEDESRQIARKIPSLSRMKMSKMATNQNDNEKEKDSEDGKLSLDEPVKILPRNRSKVHSTKSATITPNNNRGNDTSRVVQSVALPIEKPLSLNMVVDRDTVRIPLVQAHLRREGRLSKASVMKIFELALATFREEPNVLMIEAPCCVFGDLHGQFYDLMNLLDLSGTPPNTQCLFLGDYVDRGMFGLETVLYLLSFKVNFPKMFWMLRGNHESRQITQNFNFQRECVVKYGEDVYDLCMQVFDALPLAAVVQADFGNFFCVHGGIGPDVMQLRDIQSIDRFVFVFVVLIILRICLSFHFIYFPLL